MSALGVYLDSLCYSFSIYSSLKKKEVGVIMSYQEFSDYELEMLNLFFILLPIK